MCMALSLSVGQFRTCGHHENWELGRVVVTLDLHKAWVLFESAVCARVESSLALLLVTYLNQLPRVRLFLLVGPQGCLSAHNVLLERVWHDQDVNVGRSRLANTVDTLGEASVEGCLRQLSTSSLSAPHLNGLRLFVEIPDGRDKDHAVGGGER